MKLRWTTLDHSKPMLSRYSRIISASSLTQPPTRLILVGLPSRGLGASQLVQECLGLVMVVREVPDIGLDVGIVQVVQLQVAALTKMCAPLNRRGVVEGRAQVEESRT